MKKNPNVLIRKDKSGRSVKVEWYNAGEGIQGDYNPDDPTDINLLRFDVYYRDHSRQEWQVPDDSSYCTQVPDSASDEQRMKGLQMIMDEVYDPLINGFGIKKLCENLSWISLKTIAADVWAREYVL